MGNVMTYIQNDMKTSGFKIRNLARIDMLISIILMVLYTFWLFQLPRDWEPTKPQSFQGLQTWPDPRTTQGAMDPRQFRVFCFFIYIVALLVNGFQFFTALIVIGTLDRGTKDRDDVVSTAEYYIALLFLINFVTLLKFYMLLFYLEYSKTFTFIMTLPELSFHTGEIVILLMYIRRDVSPDPIVHSDSNNII